MYVQINILFNFFSLKLKNSSLLFSQLLQTPPGSKLLHMHVKSLTKLFGFNWGERLNWYGAIWVKMGCVVWICFVSFLSELRMVNIWFRICLNRIIKGDVRVYIL